MIAYNLTSVAIHVQTCWRIKEQQFSEVQCSDSRQCKVFRERTFILIHRPDIDVFKAIALYSMRCFGLLLFLFSGCFCFWPTDRFFGLHTPQGRTIDSVEQLQHWPERSWHSASKPPLEKWLSESCSLPDKARLHALGNIVVCLLAHGAKP